MAVNVLIPHTRIDNAIIDEHTPKIGLAGLGVLVIIKRYLNQKTGQCNPSYKTLARKAGVDRSTIIRYVKKLKALQLIDPELRFKEDGSPSSNQYNFPYPPSSYPPPVNMDEQDKGGAVVPLPQSQDCHSPSGMTEPPPGASVLPEQSFSPNKKERTIRDVDFFAEKNPQTNSHSRLSTSHTPMPTERQKTCPHPQGEIVILADNVTICHHCYGLLDENLKLMMEDKNTPEIVAA